MWYYDICRHKGNFYQDKASTHRHKRQYYKVNAESKEVDDTKKSNLYQQEFMN